MKVLSRLAQAAGSGLKAVFALLKVLRPDRPIHRHGVVLEGTLTHSPASSGEEWINAAGEEPVHARISRSIGLPDALPDIIGLALRIGDADVLLSTTGQGFPGRFLLTLQRSVVDGPFTSLMPFQGVGGPLVLAVKRDGWAPKLSRLSELRSHDGELQFGVYYSRLLGPWTRFGTLRLSVAVLPDEALRFDPVGRPPAGLRTYGWSRSLRFPSYTLAQRRRRG